MNPHPLKHPVVFYSIIASTLAITCMGQPSGVVDVLPVVQQDVSNEIELLGTSHPLTRSLVAAQTSGAVVTRHVSEGDQVKKGDLLVQLDTEILDAQFNAAKARVAATQAEHREQFQRLERSATLFSKGRISKEEHESDVQREKTLKQNWIQAKANARELEIRIDRMSVKAPFNAHVSRTLTEPGQWIGEGEAVAELLDLSVLEIVADMPEQYRNSLQLDQDIKIHASTGPTQKFTGRIIAVIPDANTSSRTLPVKIKLDNAAGQLHAGMDMRVRLPVSATRSATLVHKDAILTQGGAYSVFTVVDGKATPVPVTRKESYGDYVEIEGDLQPGQDVVVRGNERIRPGQDIQTRPYTP